MLLIFPYMIQTAVIRTLFIRTNFIYKSYGGVHDLYSPQNLPEYIGSSSTMCRKPQWGQGSLQWKFFIRDHIICYWHCCNESYSCLHASSIGKHFGASASVSPKCSLRWLNNIEIRNLHPQSNLMHLVLFTPSMGDHTPLRLLDY